jgi:type I restriction enzyme S subunit
MIPNGWINVKFEELVDYIQPTNYIVKSTNYSDNYKIPVLTPGKSFIKGYTNEKEGVFKALPVIIFDDFTTASRYVNFPFKVKSSAMKILVPSCSLINLKYVFYGMSITKVRNDTHKRYWISNFSQKTIPLPPLNEQHRIVAKIEELFSELGNGVANLKLAQNQLKVYRQALLKHAFEGKLTEQWRKENNPEPAEKLLERIKAERQERYEQEIKGWKAAVKAWEENGKEDKKPRKPKKAKEAEPITSYELSELPVLPNMWKWDTLVNLAELIGGVTKGRKLDGKKLITVPYLRVANVQDGYLDLNEIKTIEVLPSDLEKYRLLEGDILYTEGGDKDKLGRGTIWNNEIQNCIHQNHIFRARLYLKTMSQKFVGYYSQTKSAKDYFFSKAKQTTNLASINLTVLSNLPFPICSIDEQNQVIHELEFRLSVCDELFDTIEGSLRKSEALRQSILKKAFEGELVEQDLNDEPASELLKRIQAEKKKHLEEQKQQKKKAPKRKKKMSKELSIEEVLKNSDKPMLAQDVWQQSKHKDDIEAFYTELKKIQSDIKEVKRGTESLLSLDK